MHVCGKHGTTFTNVILYINHTTNVNLQSIKLQYKLHILLSYRKYRKNYTTLNWNLLSNHPDRDGESWPIGNHLLVFRQDNVL